MKKIIKSFISSLGYEIRNRNYKDIFTTRENMAESAEHLKSVGFYPDLVIDAGAADGTPPLQECFKESRFFWIEPLDDFKENLEALKQKYNGDYLLAAVGKQPGELTLYVSSDKMGNSLLVQNDGTPSQQEKKVSVVTLADLAAKHSFTSYEKILLKIDVQGFELEVLEGAADFIEKIDVIMLEVSFFRFSQGCPDFYDVIIYMKKKGFVVYDMFGGINRPLDMALGQKDLVFVKESGRFKKSHRWE